MKRTPEIAPTCTRHKDSEAKHKCKACQLDAKNRLTSGVHSLEENDTIFVTQKLGSSLTRRYKLYVIAPYPGSDKMRMLNITYNVALTLGITPNANGFLSDSYPEQLITEVGYKLLGSDAFYCETL